MKRLTPRNLAIFGSFTLLFGVLFSLAGLMSTPVIKNVEAMPVAPQEMPVIDTGGSKLVTKNVTGHPKRIIVKSLGINLPLVDGFYHAKDHSWTLNTLAAQFAVVSHEPSNFKPGTTFIYGHDTIQVFNRLHRIQKGAEVIVVTANGYKFIYKYHDSIIIDPFSTAEVTARSSRERLSLQTCYGPTSADRQIFHLYLDRVEKY